MSRLLGLCLLVPLCCAAAPPVTLQTLLETDQLRVSASLQPAGDIVVGQEVRLTIEVATRRWFAGGTRIRAPDVANLVILQRDQFATNQSRREGSTTWVIQQWHLELYPRREGDFRLPPVNLELSINDASAGVVSGQLQTEPLVFSATVPPAAASLDNWLATPELVVEDRLDREPVSLQPGDAVVREVLLKATRVTAMMLPPVQPRSPEGLAVYVDTPQLTDRSNRGEATAERRERLTYLVERPGRFIVPEQVFYWWDSGAGQLREAVLPELVLEAGGASAASSVARATTQPLQPAPLWLAVPVALTAILWLGRHLLSTFRGLDTGRQWRQVNRALRRGGDEEAARALYAWLNRQQQDPQWMRLRLALGHQLQRSEREQLEAILERAYGRSAHPARPGPRLRRPGGPLRLRRWLKGRTSASGLLFNPSDTA